MQDAQGPSGLTHLGQEFLRAWSDGDEDRALFPLDPHGNIASWDDRAERLEGHPAIRVLGRSASVLWEPEDAVSGGFDAALAEAADAGRAVRELWRRRNNGRRFRARVVLTALRDESGALLGFAHLTRDLDECAELLERVRRTEAELAEFHRRKDEFLAMLAHELRNPLAPLLNATRILCLKVDEPETAACMRAMIEQQVRHMARLVDDLLDITRITRGAIRLRTEEVDLGEIAASALEAACPMMDTSSLTLSVSRPERPVRLEGDATRLEQVVTNLLNNAAKYTDPGGTIHLSIEQDGDDAVLRVRDSGIGIAPPMLPRVFDLFAQADCSLARSRGGLGIGLTLVRSLVLLHGGTVQARSPGLGQGSEFIVRLPALTRADAPAPNDGDPPVAGREPGSTVLIVDDNVHAASSLAMLVEHWGHSPRVAHDGAQALDMALAHRPEVVLLDIGLPGMDGLEVARRLRQSPGLDHALIVAMTGYGQDEDRRRSREAGFDHHLVKPVDLDQLEKLLVRPAPPPASAVAVP